MPVQRVKTARGTGYRWGQSGEIYYGPDAREQAARQGRAIYAAGYRGRPQRKGK